MTHYASQATIRDKLSLVPNQPGVYLLKDHRGRVLYVGKAKALRNRLKTYLQDGDEGQVRLRRLKARVRDFEYIVTDTEAEALILEANVVKEHRPRYNVNLKDDKSYPYIKVTVNEPLPRAFLTRRVKDDGARYLGPFPNVQTTRKALRTVKRIFPIRPCHFDFEKVNPPRACLYHQIRQCLGPCYEKISQEEYRKIVEGAMGVLAGQTRAVAEELERRVEEASRAREYEKAAALRDQLEALRNLEDRQKVDSLRGEDADVVALAVEEGRACGLLMKIREGKVLGTEHHLLHNVKGEEPGTLLSMFLARYYLQREEFPSLLLLPFDFDDRRLAQDWLDGRTSRSVRVHIPKRGEKVRLVRMAARNAQFHLREELTRSRSRAGEVPLALRELQRDLLLPRLPRVICGVDISTIQGRESVGAVVLFAEGEPQKSGYRRFKIKGVEGQDDYGMLEEVLRRYLSRRLEQEEGLPDLLLIDGGKGQLSAGLRILLELGIEDLPSVAIAKREETLFLPGRHGPMILSPHSPALCLLKRVRDEAHRFAVAYHRSRRRQRLTQSVLDAISGVGPVRRRRLLTRFGSVRQMAQATVDELAAVEGISRTLARRIQRFLGS